jgi:hypothetical protein
MKLIDRLHMVNPYENFVAPQECNSEPFRAQYANLGGDSKIFETVIEQCRPKVIFEVGSWLGGSAITMGNAVKKLGLDCEIVCIDAWQGLDAFWDPHDSPVGQPMLLLKNGWPQIYYCFLNNIVNAGLQDIVVPLPMPSNTAAFTMIRMGIFADLIYLDSMHDKDSLLLELKLFSQVHRPGIMFGDDYFAAHEPVGLAVNQFYGNDFWTAPWRDPDGSLRDKRFWIHGGTPVTFEV